MRQTAKHPAAAPNLEYGRVLEAERDGIVLAASFGEIRAERAAGCLLAPRPGDMVLAVVDAKGGAWVLSVLTRDPDGAPGEIVHDGDLNIRTGGELGLHAAGNMFLAAEDKLSMAAKSAEGCFEETSITAGIFTAQIKAVTVMAGVVEQFFSSLTQRLKNSVRLVEDHEEVQAGSARRLVEDTFTVQAKNSVHVAEEVAKIDAGEIHLA